MSSVTSRNHPSAVLKATTRMGFGVLPLLILLMTSISLALASSVSTYVRRAADRRARAHRFQSETIAGRPRRGPVFRFALRTHNKQPRPVARAGRDISTKGYMHRDIEDPE